jgi:hypothetical protein
MGGGGQALEKVKTRLESLIPSRIIGFAVAGRACRHRRVFLPVEGEVHRDYPFQVPETREIDGLIPLLEPWGAASMRDQPNLEIL